ncbi:DegT/DnrJ/EryC1/StrS family aminotransferase [uncultured Roseovarius sp.]|uniref:DegT/DnrJ/EryC1/StrS family aminotransferase n=1 Tax=Roseovarius sp. TaxID=1486281 RepID=UPI0025D7C47A|nr:DegT/DnrJ/EryC1/StrS family aminotransferase [uncultured Roseovarius sp.]
MTKSIPIYVPDIGPEERENVLKCLDSTWISSKGEFILRFEDAFAEYIGAEHATAVCNGTVALHLALAALGIGPGDEVLVPTLTYIASANAVTYTGAKPVFCDCEPDTWQLSVEDARSKISSRTKAIMPVHLYGGACDMTGILALSEEHSLFVIEDCAEAIGTLHKGQHVGTFGDVATFSFFGNKTITTGEGGMLIAKSKSVFEKAVRMKGQGLAEGREYWHDVIGFNYRMTNICAAIGLAQLSKVDQYLYRKRQIAELYRNQLEGSSWIFQATNNDTDHSHWIVSLLAQEAANRDGLRSVLKQHMIETRPLFFPLHTMPMYSGQCQALPIAEGVAARGISLPSWPGLSDLDVTRICDLVKSFHEK